MGFEERRGEEGGAPSKQVAGPSTPADCTPDARFRCLSPLFTFIGRWTTPLAARLLVQGWLTAFWRQQDGGGTCAFQVSGQWMYPCFCCSHGLSVLSRTPRASIAPLCGLHRPAALDWYDGREDVPPTGVLDEFARCHRSYFGRGSIVECMIGPGSPAFSAPQTCPCPTFFKILAPPALDSQNKLFISVSIQSDLLCPPPDPPHPPVFVTCALSSLSFVKIHQLTVFHPSLMQTIQYELIRVHINKKCHGERPKGQWLPMQCTSGTFLALTCRQLACFDTDDPYHSY